MDRQVVEPALSGRLLTLVRGDVGTPTVVSYVTPTAPATEEDITTMIDRITGVVRSQKPTATLKPVYQVPYINDDGLASAPPPPAHNWPYHPPENKTAINQQTQDNHTDLAATGDPWAMPGAKPSEIFTVSIVMGALVLMLFGILVWDMVAKWRKGELKESLRAMWAGIRRCGRGIAFCFTPAAWIIALNGLFWFFLAPRGPLIGGLRRFFSACFSCGRKSGSDPEKGQAPQTDSDSNENGGGGGSSSSSSSGGEKGNHNGDNGKQPGEATPRAAAESRGDSVVSLPRPAAVFFIDRGTVGLSDSQHSTPRASVVHFEDIPIEATEAAAAGSGSGGPSAPGNPTYRSLLDPSPGESSTAARPMSRERQSSLTTMAKPMEGRLLDRKL